jgi:hypothetical protein
VPTLPVWLGPTRRRVRLVYPGVNRAPEVFEKRTVQPIVDRGDVVVAMGVTAAFMSLRAFQSDC